MNKRFIGTLLMGFAGIFITFKAVNQYIIDDESWLDTATSTKAVVIDRVIEERETKQNKRIRKYNVAIPVIEYTINDEKHSLPMPGWASSMDSYMNDSNPLYEIGDEITIMVSADDPEFIIREGESDPTNIVGFVIWGGVGLLLLFSTYRRLKVN